MITCCLSCDRSRSTWVRLCRASRAFVIPNLLACALLAACATSRDLPGVSAEDQLGWVCQRHPLGAGGPLWINKTLTATGGHESYSIGWRSTQGLTSSSLGTDLFWTVPLSGEWRHGFDHATFDFAFERQPAGAITASLYLDDRLVLSEEILDRRWTGRMQKAPMWGGTLRLPSGSQSSALLHAAERATVTVTSSDGRRVARFELPLPNWAEMDRMIADSIPLLDQDALDAHRRCEKESEPEI